MAYHTPTLAVHKYNLHNICTFNSRITSTHAQLHTTNDVWSTHNHISYIISHNLWSITTPCNIDTQYKQNYVPSKTRRSNLRLQNKQQYITSRTYITDQCTGSDIDTWLNHRRLHAFASSYKEEAIRWCCKFRIHIFITAQCCWIKKHDVLFIYSFDPPGTCYFSRFRIYTWTIVAMEKCMYSLPHHLTMFWYSLLPIFTLNVVPSTPCPFDDLL